MKDNFLEEQPKISFRTLDKVTPEMLPEMVALEETIWHRKITTEELAEWLKGAVVGAIYSGDKMIGNVITRTEAQKGTGQMILENLPPESLNADGSAVLPDFRGRGLQKTLLLSRIELARNLGKETIVSTVRAENGASLRNIINSGARILAYSLDYYPNTEDPARLIWENDLKIPNERSNVEEKKNVKFPDVMLNVKSGEEADLKAQQEIAKILSGDYIGIAVNTSKKDEMGVPLDSTIVFRHLSSFSPDVAKRLRERKQKIQEMLKPTQENLENKK